MIKFYTIRKGLALTFFMCFLLLINRVQAQTTLYTPVPTALVYYSDTDPGVIVFGVRNNNATPIIVTSIGSYVEPGYGDGSYTLWYHTSAVTGAPMQITAANGWQQASPSGSITVTANGVVPVISGLSITIPANTTYRFALQSPIKGPFYGMATSTGNIISTGGVDIYLQNNASSPCYAGAFSAVPGNTPRSFYGSITFAPSNACAGTPIPGTAYVVNNPATAVCNGSSFTLDLTGNTVGTGQTYQWQSSNSGAGPWANIGTASASQTLTTTQTASTYYRCQVTCGSTPTLSTTIQVVNNVPLAGTYTIDKVLPASATNFTSFNSAVNALGCGITGPVVFNVTAGQTFTEAPILLNATGTATNTITFQKAGTGADPVFVPSVPGTILSSTTIGGDGDGIITINGGDYITFNGIGLNASSFSAGVDMYEYGYYFKKATPNNASKNVSIKNSTITLNKNAIFSFGIYVSNFYNTTVAAPLSNGGRTENIQLDSNTIANCYGGIQLRGASDDLYYDQNIKIGVSKGNSITGFGGGASIGYGIYAIYQNGLQIANNTIVSATGTTTTLYGVFTSTGTNSNVEIYSNTITVHGGGTTTTVYGISNAMGSTGTNNLVSIYNNNITGSTYPFATSGGMQAIAQTSSAFKAHIYGNTVANNTLSPTTTGVFYGIYQSGAVVNESKIYNNTVSDNIRSTGTSGVWYGIENSPAATANSEIYGNILSGNRILAGTTGVMNSILQSSGAVANIYGNRIYNMFNNSTGAGIYGISVTAGTTNNVYNNYVSDLAAPQASLVDALRGINVNYTTANTNINVSNNTVYLNATSTGTNFSADGIYHTTSTTATSASLTLRNNIIVNLSAANGTGFNAAFRRSSGAANTLNNFGLASNNNLYYVGTPSTKQLIFYDGTNSDQTLVAYKTRVGPNRDSVAISENPPFISVAVTPYDLHIKTNVPTQIESGGRPVTGVTDDFDGDTRNATTPDIGADEFTGIAADLTGPVISYTALPVKSICIEDKTITAVIADGSGVNTTGGTKPRLWFKKASNANVLPANNTAATDGWKWVEASNAISPFSFTFNLSLLNSPVVAGDSISYFIVAQDLATVPNVGAVDASFATMPATVALSANAFPATGTINGFKILVQPSPIAIKTSRTDLCNGGTVTLDINGVDITGGTYQWQVTHHGTNNWVDIANGNTVPYTTATLSDSSDFRLIVKCGGTPIASSPSNIISVNVNNPQISSTTPATRCGTGTVTLAATAPSGLDIKWFGTSTSQSPIGTGGSFVTPSISSTTTFYASASSGGGSTNTAMAASPITTSTSGAGTTNFGIVFDALSAFTLNSVVVYPVSSAANTAGTVTIDVVDGTGTVLNTATVNVIGNPAASATAQVVALNFNILPGTNLKLRPGSRSSNITGLLFEPSASAPSGNYGYPYTIPGVLSINHSTLTAPPANTQRLDLYYYFYNWEVATGCDGTRVPVVATVTTPPALTSSTANHYKSVCNDVVDSLTITSSPTSFDTFVWSPTTNLFIDAACTVPYTGTSLLKVYVKGSTPSQTSYKCTATHAASSCANEITDTVLILPNPTISNSKPILCVSGTSVLSLTPATGYAANTLQWQNSPNGTVYTDINGANGASYTTPSITATTYYKLLLKNSVGQVCSASPTALVTVNSPQVVTNVPGTRCGTGTVNLSATASAGNSINWYAAATGGIPLLAGSNLFTTPSISATTTFYASAVTAGGSIQTASHGVPNVTTATQNTGLLFNLNVDATLNSVDVYTNGTAGAVTITLSNSANTIIYTSPTFNVISGTLSTPQTLQLDWPITAGNNYRILVASHTPNLGYHTGVFPIDLGNGVGSVTTGATATGTTTLNYFIYNMKTTVGCESGRTAITATVDNTPGCSIVPITLLSFKGERQGTINKLNWITSTETNNAGFELQRSADGTNFSSLAFVASRAINGSSNLPLTYSFDDTKPLLGNGYYRLRQVDKDGKNSYSQIVQIKANRVSSLVITNIFPNPVKDKLGIAVQSPVNDLVTIVVTDITGKTLLRKQVTVEVGGNNLQLDVLNMAAGSYFIKLICANGCETTVQKFVK